MGITGSNPPWRTSRRVPTGQRQIFKVREPLKIRVGGEQRFPTPDGAIGAVPGSVEGETDQAPILQAIIRHTGSYMGMMMLHSHARDIQLRASRIFGCEIIRMQIICNELWFDAEDMREVSDT